MENRVRYAFVLLALVAFAQSNPTDTTNTAEQLPSITVTPPSPDTQSVDSNAVKTTATNDSNLSIDVYYEAMCIDSVNFVNKQLIPVYENLNTHINVTFIPFALGNITVKDNSVTLNCSREGECEADKVHACSILKISDKDKLVKFVNCSLVEGFKPKAVPIDACAKSSGIDNDTIAAIKTCISIDNTTSEWYPLLDADSKKSRTIPVKHVPTIVFDKSYSSATQELSLKDFKKAVCQKISHSPNYCAGTGSGASTVYVGVLPILISVYCFIKLF